MTYSQNSIFNESSTQFYYLEYQLDFKKDKESIRSALQDAMSSSDFKVNVVISFGKQAWDFLNPSWSPADLRSYKSLTGPKGYAMPSTQRDVFFWIHSNRHDLNFDQVLQIQDAMKRVASIELDIRGFNYHNDLDLIGFEDGTANPKADDRQLAALIPNGEVGAGGAYVLSQKWIHDLYGFKQLSDHHQGLIIGRTKDENRELEGDEMPIDSHISRTDLKIDGEAMKIYRRSDPYGNATEHGLYFLAFACEIKRFQTQLESMLGLTEDGIHDRLIEFSNAATTSYWFAPSNDDLVQALSQNDFTRRSL